VSSARTPKTWFSLRRKWQMLRWLIRMPFGLPVEPYV